MSATFDIVGGNIAIKWPRSVRSLAFSRDARAASKAKILKQQVRTNKS